MEPWVQMLVTVVCAVVASGGFWSWMQSRRDKKDAKTKMILGLGFDRIVNSCEKYIERGWITSDEYSDLNKYLYVPYRDMNGDGTAERLMNEVKKLPIKPASYLQEYRSNQNGSNTDARFRN